MWPWEHLAVGYLVYSTWCRLRTDHPPTDSVAVLAVALGALFPDLVDKPLAWGLGVLPTGTALGHSVFFALPATGLVLLLARRAGRPTVGVAFGIGYLLHLPADALYGALVYDTPVHLGAFIWPLGPSPTPERVGFGANVAYYLGKFAAVLSTRTGRVYLVLELVLLGGSLVQWLRDGTPGLSLLPGQRRVGAARRS